jgi:hypothetical protein
VSLSKSKLEFLPRVTCVNNCLQAAQMTASATLPTADKRLIGLYLLGVDVNRGLLGSITTVAFFQCNGKMPRTIVGLRRQHSRSTAPINNCFYIMLVISSGLGAFRLGKAIINLTTTVILIGSSCSPASTRKFDS